MLSLDTKLKDLMIKIKSSLEEILFGFILFILAISGLFMALFLRSLNLNGGIITSTSLITEILSITLCYIIFNKKYLKEKSESQKREKGKK